MSRLKFGPNAGNERDLLVNMFNGDRHGKDGHYNVCVVRDLADEHYSDVGEDWLDKDPDYITLHKWHCADFKRMDAETIRELKALTYKVCRIEPVQIRSVEPEVRTIKDITPARPPFKTKFLQKMLG